MNNPNNKTIFHIDVNSAYLSWEAVYRLQQGEQQDLRTIPSVVGGDPKARKGIVLTKSIPAKKYGIHTGESLYSALEKCPNLTIVSPSYELYMKCSNSMVNLLRKYSPKVQRYSVDECFLDYTSMNNHFGNPLEAAHMIKDRIHKELGFTVNIGISTNKLLAKMASDLKKPNRVHTLFPHEIKTKMWPLPVEALYMVGRATAPKLHRIGIYSIGDLATADINLIKYKLKSHGIMIWNYANGLETSNVRIDNYIVRKGVGNSTTIAFDVIDRKTALMILLSLTEMVAMRLRNMNSVCKVVSVKIKTTDFQKYSHQKRLFSTTDSTVAIYKAVQELFDEAWQNEPIRHLGIRVSEICSNEFYQASIFDSTDLEKRRALDSTIDNIRLKYGIKTIIRGSFLHSGIKPVTGGVGADDYPMMSSIL